jgi:outer membrane lipoprotein carrier protein
MFRRNILPLALCLTVAFSSHSLTPPAIVKAEARYRAASTLQATFLERYLENGRVVRAEAGVAYFRKPGRMRWDYQSPEKSQFIVDGKTAWFYVPSDKTVARVPARKSEDWRTPLALLAGELKFSRVCSKVANAPTERPVNPGDEVFTCILREPSFATTSGQSSIGSAKAPPALIEISPQSGELAGIVVSDPGGTSIEFQFRNWQFNPPLPEALFHFQLPPGTAIVNGELPTRENPVNP